MWPRGSAADGADLPTAVAVGFACGRQWVGVSVPGVPLGSDRQLAAPAADVVGWSDAVGAGEHMRFGIVLPNVAELAERGALVRVAQAAEELGYHSLWTSDHLLIPPDALGRRVDCLEALTTLAYLAPLTSRILLGTSVVVAPLRDPILLAKQAATVHQLSGGRLLLGLGVGWLQAEFELIGAAFDERGENTDEILARLKDLLVARHPAPIESAHRRAFSPRVDTDVPLLIGGNSGPALERAARYGNGWHGVWLEPEEVALAAATIASYQPSPGFEISLRTDLNLDADADAEVLGLRGAPRLVAEQIAAYERAGVQHLVVDLMNRDDYSVPTLAIVLEQLAHFAMLTGLAP